MASAALIEVSVKQDLAPWGYASGDSLFYCTDCQGSNPHAGHRHSTRCIQHALEAQLRARTTAAMGVHPTLPPEVCNAALRKANRLALIAWLSCPLGLILVAAIFR